MSTIQIIVAEDEAELRQLIGEVLAEKGFEVILAADGVEALQLVQEHMSASLLLSDVKMPRMNGYELVNKALDVNPELKVLMLTAYAHDPSLAAWGAQKIKTLAKPFNMQKMCDVVCDMVAEG